ncbi:hypothetical protein Bbelb_282620 [Branchiostoma belcheri]|nr:hypothetical protein Bbelb_282620 [Branchiostoma belcheri]
MDGQLHFKQHPETHHPAVSGLPRGDGRTAALCSRRRLTAALGGHHPLTRRAVPGGADLEKPHAVSPSQLSDPGSGASISGHRHHTLAHGYMSSGILPNQYARCLTERRNSGQGRDQNQARTELWYHASGVDFWVSVYMKKKKGNILAKNQRRPSECERRAGARPQKLGRSLVIKVMDFGSACWEGNPCSFTSPVPVTYLSAPCQTYSDYINLYPQRYSVQGVCRR